MEEEKLRQQCLNELIHKYAMIHNVEFEVAQEKLKEHFTLKPENFQMIYTGWYKEKLKNQYR